MLATRAQRSAANSNVSSESIASPPQLVGAPEPCRGCGAPLADDQRYCLECGERRTPMSSVLLGAAPSSSPAPQGPPGAPPLAPGPAGDGAGRGNAATLIAGVGVLLLAMGVGVLIGRSGGGAKAPSAAPQVITVGSVGASTGTGPSATEASFSDDWPSGTSGYTVRLQTLPVAGTQVSAVQAAKSAASAKGAKGVGALKSEDFSSLPAGNYVIYSGIYHKRAEAQKALAALKKIFPGAGVVKVSNASTSSTSGSGSGATPSGAGSTPSNPAPPSVVEGLKNVKGKSYEEKSKNLPNVISTG